MTMFWDDAKSFKKHVERMMTFRQSHPSDQKVKADFIEKMPAFHVTHPVRETGGARVLIDVGNWPTLITLREVSLKSFPKN